MPITSNYEINGYYDFDVVADSILGSSYRGARLISIMDYRIAKKFDSIDYIHRQVRPYISPMKSKDITTYTFFLFRYKERDLVIAKEWMSSMELSNEFDKKFLKLTINGISDGMREILEKHLNILGLDYDIDEVN